MGGDIAAGKLRIAFELDENIDAIVENALRGFAIVERAQIDESVEAGHESLPHVAAVIVPMRIGDDLESTAVVTFNEIRHQKRGRVAREIRRQVADLELALAVRTRLRPLMREARLGAQPSRPQACTMQVKRRRNVHVEQVKRHERPAMVGNGRNDCCFFVFEVCPVASAAPLVVELQGYAEHARIAGERAAIGGGGKRRLPRTVISRTQSAMRHGQVRIECEGFLKGYDRFGERALLEQCIAEIVMGLRVAGLERERTTVGFDGLAWPQELAQEIAGVEMERGGRGIYFGGVVANRQSLFETPKLA